MKSLFPCVLQIPRRILAVYILYFMYASHPITINPFRSAFAEVFLREREVSRVESERGGVSENEQLVWVLWKVLKGDGDDVCVWFSCIFFYRSSFIDLTHHTCMVLTCPLRNDIARTLLTYNAVSISSPTQTSSLSVDH